MATASVDATSAGGHILRSFAIPRAPSRSCCLDPDGYICGSAKGNLDQVVCHETANAPRPGAAIPVADRQSDRISPRVADNAISMLRANDGSMAEAKTKKGLISHGIAAQNRKARF